MLENTSPKSTPIATPAIAAGSMWAVVAASDPGGLDIAGLRPVVQWGPVLPADRSRQVADERALVQAGIASRRDVERMIKLARMHGADAAMRDLIAREVEAARAALASFPVSTARAALEDLADQELRRVA